MNDDGGKSGKFFERIIVHLPIILCFGRRSVMGSIPYEMPAGASTIHSLTDNFGIMNSGRNGISLLLKEEKYTLMPTAFEQIS